MSLIAASFLLASAAIDVEHQVDQGGWDASLRAGYGYMFTTGVSPVGVGAGPSLARVFRSHVRLELAAMWSYGTSERATNGSFTYRSSYASMHLTGGVGYELALGPLRITPGARVGGLRVEGTTHDGAAKFHDEQLHPMFGPSLLLIVRVGHVELGVDGEAYYLPTWVASPICALYATGGVRF
jgi:hypothetical protein